MAPCSTYVILSIMFGVAIASKQVPVASDENPSYFRPSATNTYIDLYQSDKSNITPTVKNRLANPNVRINARLQSSCALNVSDESRDFFSQAVINEKYNFMYLKLHFHNVTEVDETKKVINRFDWIWTYKGEGGAHQYLYLPGDFGYLSFGLLWLHTRTHPTDIDIEATGDCRKLQIGTHKTDDLIGHALGSMTAPIASHHVIYNHSYWCYNNRMWIESNFLYHLCTNAICTFQTFEYRCCKYVLHMNMTRTVECNREHYHFGALWWMLPIVVGEIMFAFYPILLTKFGMIFTEWSQRVKERRHLPTSMSYMGRLTRDHDTDKVYRKYNFVTLKEHFPISFLSTILSPICQWDCNGPFLSRVMRLWLIVSPVAICTIRVGLDYTYAGDLVKGAVKKGALVGFSSLIAGPEAANFVLFRLFNGPLTAIVISLVFSILLVVFPKRLDKCLEKGLPESSNQYMFLIKIPLKLRERFSGISVRKHVGYKRFHQLLIAQTFMLLHWKFWRHALKLFCVRWSNVIFPVIPQTRRFVILAALFCVIIFPMYVIFSFIELIFAAVYFMFPVVNSFVIVLKAFMIEYFALFQNRGICLKLMRNLLICPLIVLFLLSWYMYCLIFFDAFWFLSKIVMFTYSGIIAYPKISYGYMILCLMSLYYMVESAHAFGESYRELLKVSIDVIGKINEKHGHDQEFKSSFKHIVEKHGMNRNLFFYIVNKHRPRRNQVMITLLKFVSIITILTISVELLITFDKFQDLSLVSHVFTVLFVCSLPKIIRVLCTQRFEMESKRRLRAKIKRTFFMYLTHRMNSLSDIEYEYVRTEYDTISGNGSDVESVRYDDII